MNPKEAFLIKTGSYRTHLFPAHNKLCAEQDVAPFLLHISIYVRETVAKASQDLIPPPFVMRMQQYVKERLKLNSNKKARLNYIKRALSKIVYLYHSPYVCA